MSQNKQFNASVGKVRARGALYLAPNSVGSDNPFLPLGDSKPQRLPFWHKSASFILVLGMLDVPDITPVNQQGLHAFRATAPVVAPPQRLYAWPVAKDRTEPYEAERRTDHGVLHAYRGYPVPQSGHFLVAATQVVLYDVEREPTRIDHATRLFFGRTSATTATQPFWIWPQIEPPVEQVEVERRSNHDLLHRYRVGYQTVGQPWLTWSKPPREIPGIEPDAQRVDHTARLFYGRASTALSPGQPWYLWEPQTLEPTVEPDARRIDHTLLHRYRVGFQTVGQPWITWPAPAKIESFIESDAVRTHHELQLFYGRAPATSSVGQPWYMWKPAVGEQLVEADAVRQDYSGFIISRTSLVVVGPAGTDSYWIIRARRRMRR